MARCILYYKHFSGATKMNINHIALYVNDLDGMKSFYEKHFNAKSNDMYHNQKTGLRTYFLTFDNSCRIEIMARENVKHIDKDVNNIGYIHIAFSVGDKEKVDTLTQTLEEDGYKIVSRPRITGDGYYESCVCDPENNLIEIVE